MLETSTLSLDEFWSWLVMHPNCVLRAGTAEAVLYDDNDLHWSFSAEGSSLYVELIRGKRLVGEMVIDSERVAYVTVGAQETEGEYAFELISETETERVSAYFFVLSHGLEEEPPPGHGRAVH